MSVLEKLPPNPTIGMLAPQATADGRLDSKRDRGIFEITKPIIPTTGLPWIEPVLRQEGFTNITQLDPRFNKKGGRLTDAEKRELFSKDVLMLTAMAVNFPPALEAARQAKQYNPGIFVIIGGPHATYLDEACLDAGADLVVRGEGERVIVNTIKSLIDSGSAEGVKGISYKDKDTIVRTEMEPLLTPEELSDLPAPVFNKMVLDRSAVDLTQTTRGCPYDCFFCSVTALNGRRYRRRSNDVIMAELEESYARSPLKPKFFIDDNFFPPGKRNEVKELLRMTIGTSLIPDGSFIQVRADAAKDDEFLELLRLSGISGVYVGYESMDPSVLEGMEKQISPEEYEEYTRKFRQDAGMWVHGMFILGADGKTPETSDTPQSIRRTMEWAKRSVHSMQAFSPVPLPGTRMTAQMEKDKRVISREYNLYNGLNVTTEPYRMTPWQLHQLVEWSYKYFYDGAGWAEVILRDTFRDKTHFSMAEKIAYGFGSKSAVKNVVQRDLKFRLGGRLMRWTKSDRVREYERQLRDDWKPGEVIEPPKR